MAAPARRRERPPARLQVQGARRRPLRALRPSPQRPFSASWRAALARAGATREGRRDPHPARPRRAPPPWARLPRRLRAWGSCARSRALPPTFSRRAREGAEAWPGGDPLPGAPPSPPTPWCPRGAPYLGSPAAPRAPAPPPAAGGGLDWRAGVPGRRLCGGSPRRAPPPGGPRPLPPQASQLSPGAHSPPQKLPRRKRKWGRRRTMALLRGGEAGAGASALGPRRGGAGGGGRRRRGRARGGGSERAREGARRSRPPSPGPSPRPALPPVPRAARASGRSAPRPRLRRLRPRLHPRPGPREGRPGERPRRRVVGPGSGSLRRERIHLHGARALTYTHTHTRTHTHRYTHTQTAGDTRGPGLLDSDTDTERTPTRLRRVTDTHSLRVSPRYTGAHAHSRCGSWTHTSCRMPRTQTHTHNLRCHPDRHTGTHMLTAFGVSPRHPQPPRCHIHRLTASRVSLRHAHRLTIVERHFRQRTEPHADPPGPLPQAIAAATPAPECRCPGYTDTNTHSGETGQMGTQTETRTLRVTDLGGRGSLGVPQGLQAGRGAGSARGGSVGVGGSGRPLPGSGLREKPPQRGEGPGRGGSAPPPLLRGLLRAGKPCRSAPAPRHALSRSPPSSGSRRVGTAPFSPPPLRLCVWRNWGTTGGGLAATWWDGGGSAAVLLSGFPPACDLTSPQLGLQDSGTPLGRWFSAPPGRTPGFRAGAGSTPGAELGPGPPFWSHG